MTRKTLSVLIIGFSILCLLYVWLRLDIIHLGYHIEQLEQEKIGLERRHEDLQVHWSQLMSPEAIAQAASKNLGLKNPQPGQIILVTRPPRKQEGQSRTETGFMQLAKQEESAP